MNKALKIQKQDTSLPDSFQATIHYHDKTTEVFDTVYIGLHDEVYSVHTAKDLWFWIPKDSIKKVEFDKDFSIIQQKMVEEMKNKALKKQEVK